MSTKSHRSPTRVVTLEVIHRCKVKPALNQIEFNPYCCDEDILKACEEHGIIVQAYSPIGSGSRIGARGESKMGMCIFSGYRYKSIG